METTRLSTKGQPIIPKNIRVSHNWQPGTEFSVEETAEGILLRPTTRFSETKLDNVVGFLRSNGPRKTLVQMDSSIDDEVRRRRESSRY